MNERNETRLGTAPIGRLILQFAFPATLAQAANFIYTLVNKMYMGHLEGDDAMSLTAIGLCYPIVLFVTACVLFIAVSGSTLAGIELGCNNREKAEKILGNSIFLTLALSALLMGVFLVFKEPILYAMGASENTFPYADRYITIYLIGTPFIMLSSGLNGFISFQGRSGVAMMTTVIGAAAAMILDPIFIFTFDMGIAGAALATVIAQFLSTAWVVGFLLSPRSVLRIRRETVRPDLSVCGRLARVGVSAFLAQFMECLITVTYNRELQRWGGDLYVGSMTVLMSAMSLYGFVCAGFNGGLQPIISFNYGAGKYDRVLYCVRRMTVITFGIAVFFFLTFTFTPGFYARLYTDKEPLIALVTEVFPIYARALWSFCFLQVVTSVFTALGQYKYTFFIAFLRKVALMTPLTVILPNFFGVNSIYAAEAISDFSSSLASVLLFIPVYKKFKHGENIGPGVLSTMA